MELNTNQMIMLARNLPTTFTNIEDFRKFLDYASARPDFSFDNVALMYIQGVKETHVTTKSNSRVLAASDKPIVLFDLQIRKDDTTKNLVMYQAGIFYPVKTESPKRISLREAFSRLNLTCVIDETVSEPTLDREKRRVLIPKEGNQKEIEYKMVMLFVDLFWVAISKTQAAILMTKESDFETNYREGLAYMMCRYLQVGKPYISQTLFQKFRPGRIQKPSNPNVDEAQLIMQMMMNPPCKKLGILQHLWQELAMVLDGLHLNFFETRLLQITNGQVKSYPVRPAKISLDLIFLVGGIFVHFDHMELTDIPTKYILLFPTLHFKGGKLNV